MLFVKNMYGFNKCEMCVVYKLLLPLTFAMCYLCLNPCSALIMASKSIFFLFFLGAHLFSYRLQQLFCALLVFHFVCICLYLFVFVFIIIIIIIIIVLLLIIIICNHHRWPATKVVTFLAACDCQLFLFIY